MNNRKYEIMEAHLKGELTVLDLIDRIVELEDTKQLHEIKETYSVKEYIFDSKADAQNVLNALVDYADKYSAVSVAEYYDMINVKTMYVDNHYGWTFEAIRRKAYVTTYRNTYTGYANRRNLGRYVIVFPPVEVLK